VDVAGDVSRGEQVEHEIDAMIRRRDTHRRETEGHRPSEELWQASVDRYNAERDAELRAAWCSYHQEAATRHRRTLEALIARHEEAAARLMENPQEKESA
jgi:hypothetical protein